MFIEPCTRYRSDPLGEQADFVTYGVKMYSIHAKYTSRERCADRRDTVFARFRFFQEILLVFKTNRFMSMNPAYLDEQNQSTYDDLAEGRINQKTLLIL